MIVGVVGKKNTGKDTFANIFIKSRPDFKIYHFGDPLKKLCSFLSDIPLENFNDRTKKEGIPRQMMQYIGTDIFRKCISEDYWVQVFSSWWEENKHQNIIIPDVRFQNEIDFIKQKNGKIIKIIKSFSSIDDKHISETGIDYLQGVDTTIENNGTLEEFIEKINGYEIL
jgi:hypothetical protein